jgi:MFS family permease
VGLDAAAQTVTAFAIAYGVLQLAYGPIGDRYGKYRVITLATIGCALTSIGCALAPTLACARDRTVAGGRDRGRPHSAFARMDRRRVPYERRQSVLARYLIGQMFGIALGQVLGGIGADYLGAGPVFIMLAAWFAANGSAHVVASTVPSGGSAQKCRQRSQPVRGGAPGSVVAVVLLTFSPKAVLVGALAFVPTHLHRAYGCR